MEDEIFGPVLPVVAYDTVGSVVNFVRSRPNPLALYIFTTDSETRLLSKPPLSVRNFLDGYVAAVFQGVCPTEHLIRCRRGERRGGTSRE